MYSHSTSKTFDKKITKLFKRNNKRYKILLKKMNEIISSPKNYKNLRGDKFGLKRVHIDIHFVLTFKINHYEEKVYFEDFDHHDKIYKN
jgi:YafQ family addiction module toxin component